MTNKKPCPFCGGKPMLQWVRFGEPTDGDQTYIKCIECHARCAIGTNEAESVKDWNRRTPAARDAERDAKWAKRDRIAIKALTWYAIHMKGRWNGAMDMDLLAEEARLALVALGAWPIDAALANLGAEEKPSQVRVNAEKDPTYAPFCLRCSTMARMKETERFLWQCQSCLAIHDERKLPPVPAQEPKCACPNPSLHTELAEGREIDPSKCAKTKPETKCGECKDTRVICDKFKNGGGQIRSCPSCSKEPR